MLSKMLFSEAEEVMSLLERHATGASIHSHIGMVGEIAGWASLAKENPESKRYLMKLKESIKVGRIMSTGKTRKEAYKILNYVNQT